MAARWLNVAMLYSALDSKREAGDLSWREVAREVGVNHALFTRLAKGHRPDVDAFLTLTGWLGIPAEYFMDGGEVQVAQEDTVEVISKYLRVDRALQPKSAHALESILRAAYDVLGRRAA